MMIVGKPGSSRTTLIMNMICKRGKMYNKKYDRIYLFKYIVFTAKTHYWEGGARNGFRARARKRQLESYS